MRNEPRRIAHLGPLHDLMLDACPPDDQGRRSIPVLAAMLGISNEGVYRYIRQGRLPARRAKQISDLSEGRVSFEDFLPYLY